MGNGCHIEKNASNGISYNLSIGKVEAGESRIKPRRHNETLPKRKTKAHKFIKAGKTKFFLRHTHIGQLFYEESYIDGWGNGSLLSQIYDL